MVRTLLRNDANKFCTVSTKYSLRFLPFPFSSSVYLDRTSSLSILFVCFIRPRAHVLRSGPCRSTLFCSILFCFGYYWALLPA